LVELTEGLKEAIARGASRAELRAAAEAGGMQPLQMDGWQKVEAGLTTIEEVLRVIQH
jgi:type II secretory ATPase GspE/PulE/Tfp pilus assembly ATPase PilB-like protein